MSAEIPSEMMIEKIQTLEQSIKKEREKKLDYELELAVSTELYGSYGSFLRDMIYQTCPRNIQTHQLKIDYLLKQLHDRNVPGY